MDARSALHRRNPSHPHPRGQGSAEYLLVLSAVLIIAIVAIVLMTGAPNRTSDIRSSTSDVYWSSQATPFHITSKNLSTNGVLTLTLVNSGPTTLQITHINVSGNGLYTSSFTSPLSVGAGKRALASVYLNGSCSPGQMYELAVDLTYLDADSELPARIQSGAQPLLGVCGQGLAPGPANVSGGNGTISNLSNGAGCTLGSDCQSGHCNGGLCVSCVHDGDCPSGDACVNNSCQLIVDRPIGTGCALDSNCQSGHCSGGLCVSCVQNGDCQSGYSCLGNTCSQDIVNFTIANGSVKLNQNNGSAVVTIIGAQITYGGQYDIPVTVKVKVGNQTLEPWGSFTLPVDSNVNDNNNPRTYNISNLSNGTAISITGQSWLKISSSYSGKKNSDWYVYLTRSSSADPTWVKVLRNGDPLPNVPVFMGQKSLGEMLGNYVVNKTIVMDKNSAIYLFELGTTDINDAAADFQDLVVIVTLSQ